MSKQGCSGGILTIRVLLLCVVFLLEEFLMSRTTWTSLSSFLITLGPSKNNLRTNRNRHCSKSAASCRGQVTKKKKKNVSKLEQHYVCGTPRAMHMPLADKVAMTCTKSFNCGRKLGGTTWNSQQQQQKLYHRSASKEFLVSVQCALF